MDQVAKKPVMARKQSARAVFKVKAAPDLPPVPRPLMPPSSLRASVPLLANSKMHRGPTTVILNIQNNYN